MSIVLKMIGILKKKILLGFERFASAVRWLSIQIQDMLLSERMDAM